MFNWNYANLILCWLVLPTVDSIRLVDNGYEEVVINIGKNVIEDPKILKRLENYLTVTSQALFTATRQRIYFRKITIVIPQTWSHSSLYSNAKDSETEHAQILIDTENPAYGHAPYVKQYAECGSPGLYIHLTPEYLLNYEITFRWGLPGKTLAHEWAHLRWGLFDEYPIDPQDSPFYRYAGQWHPTRCTTEVEGILKNENRKEGCLVDLFTGKPSASCKFFPRIKQNKAVASIMFMQYLESVVEFCDDAYSSPVHLRHNNLAPNRQNRLCNYRSAWEVMKKHQDFRSTHKSLPRGFDTTPTFRYVQVRPRRRVLVLDTSGSMSGSSLKILRQAATNFIMNSIETGSSLGIVEFNTAATTLSALVRISSRADRELLINRLPKTATGKTSIGGGLLKAIQALLHSKSGVGGTLILITDGQENESPWITDIKPSLLKQGVMVHALAYGQKAETGISALADETGGRTFFFSGQRQSTLVDSLAAMVMPQSSEGFESPVTIVSDTQILDRGTPYMGKFDIDSSLGKDTVLTFMHEDPIDVIIRGPNNTEIKVRDVSSSGDADINGGYLQVPLNGNTSTTGEWTYEIRPWRRRTLVSVSVTSQPPVENGLTNIQTKSWISKTVLEFNPKEMFVVFSEVRRGNAPVLGAQVYATFDGPNSTSSLFTLKDNGIGSDLISGDGIYSAYILAKDLQGNGHYNMKITVIGTKKSTKVVTKGNRSGALAVGEAFSAPNFGQELAPVEDFQRISSAGAFRVEGFPQSLADIVDVIAPSRITDLLIEEFDQDNGRTSLKWTAVGNDMDRGKAHRYYIHTSHDFAKIRENIDETNVITDIHVILGSLDNPKEPGEFETILLNIPPAGNNTIFVAVRAGDEHGNVADVSNIVTLSYTTDIAVKWDKQTPANSIYLKTIIPAVGGFILLLVVVSCCCLCWTKRESHEKRMAKKKALALESVAFDVYDETFMNYKSNGRYPVRFQEVRETWD